MIEIEESDHRMKKKGQQIFLGIAFSLFLFSSLSLSSGLEYSLGEAQKVLNLIEKIQAEQSTEPGSPLRKVAVTESELNSYIAYRIEREKEEVMKELKLKLFGANRIEGKIFVDLQGQKLPRFLNPCMNLYFSAVLEVKKGAVRIAFKKLFVEGQTVQPEVLNLIFFIAAKIENIEPFRMDDWYLLPYGVKDIQTEQGSAVFFY